MHDTRIITMIFSVISIANCNDTSNKKIKFFYSHVCSKFGKILKSLTLSLSLPYSHTWMTIMRNSLSFWEVKVASTIVLGFALDLLGIYLIMPTSGLCIFFRWDFDKVSISAHGFDLVYFFRVVLGFTYKG